MNNLHQFYWLSSGSEKYTDDKNALKPQYKLELFKHREQQNRTDGTCQTYNMKLYPLFVPFLPGTSVSIRGEARDMLAENSNKHFLNCAKNQW